MFREPRTTVHYLQHEIILLLNRYICSIRSAKLVTGIKPAPKTQIVAINKNQDHIVQDTWRKECKLSLDALNSEDSLFYGRLTLAFFIQRTMMSHYLPFLSIEDSPVSLFIDFCLYRVANVSVMPGKTSSETNGFPAKLRKAKTEGWIRQSKGESMQTTSWGTCGRLECVNASINWDAEKLTGDRNALKHMQTNSASCSMSTCHFWSSSSLVFLWVFTAYLLSLRNGGPKIPDSETIFQVFGVRSAYSLLCTRAMSKRGPRTLRNV